MCTVQWVLINRWLKCRLSASNSNSRGLTKSLNQWLRNYINFLKTINQTSVILKIFLILSWNSFAVNNCLESRTQGHHQMQCFLPWDGSAFTTTTFHCCLFVGLSVFVFNKWKALLGWNKVTDFVIEESLIPLPVKEKLLGCFLRLLWVIIHLHFGWIWAESIVCTLHNSLV